MVKKSKQLKVLKATKDDDCKSSEIYMFVQSLYMVCYSKKKLVSVPINKTTIKKNFVQPKLTALCYIMPFKFSDPQKQKKSQSLNIFHKIQNNLHVNEFFLIKSAILLYKTT